MIKDRIIKACIREVNNKGYRFTMDDIAKDVGISKRTLYEHFSSKEKLIENIIEGIVQKINHRDSAIALDTTLTSIEKLRLLGLVIVEEIKYIDERAIYDVSKNYPNLYAMVDECLVNRAILQESIIKEGIDKGEIRNINHDVFLKILNISKTWLLDKDFLMDKDLTISEGVKSLIDILLFGISE